MGQCVPPGKLLIFFTKSKLKTVELVARPDGMQAGGMNEHDAQAMEAGGAFGLGTSSDPEHADVAPTVAAVAPFADRFPLQVNNHQILPPFRHRTRNGQARAIYQPSGERIYRDALLT